MGGYRDPMDYVADFVHIDPEAQRRAGIVTIDHLHHHRGVPMDAVREVLQMLGIVPTRAPDGVHTGPLGNTIRDRITS